LRVPDSALGRAAPDDGAQDAPVRDPRRAPARESLPPVLRRPRLAVDGHHDEAHLLLKDPRPGFLPGELASLVRPRQTGDVDAADLQACIQDLIGIISLPAIWRGGNEQRVAGVLLDVLVEMLRLDFAYASLQAAPGEIPVAMARVSLERVSDLLPEQVSEAIEQLGQTGGWRLTRLAIAGMEYAVASLPLGLHGQAGEVFAASRRESFPATTERLLFSIAANQAVVGIQEARILGEQKRLAADLERKVLHSTAELRKEIAERIQVEKRLREIVAERERSEEILRRNEALFKQAQHLSSTGSWYWRVAGDVVELSEQSYAIYELDPGIPVTLEVIATRIHPEDMGLLREMIDVARGPAADLDYLYRARMPDGTVKHLHLVAHGSRGRNGELEYIGAIQDVTQRHLAEEALARARSELAHVARVTTIGALTASIAHEVNQPLAGILTNASTCLRMLAADPPDLDGARETARRTIRDSTRAADVIARLRALFSRKRGLAEPLDLNEATREVMALSTGELHRSRVTLRLELADALPPVIGDRVQLQQVILNLIVNALDAMSAVAPAARELVVATALEGAVVHLSVRDTGTGVPPDSTERLFEPFFTTKAKGMGIGLWVSRSIVESHGGRLWAARNDGAGATFRFTLPSAPGG
ncbi:ATP-binding protein, partial [Streptococcus pyogenes]|uniref:ATP-binding protein n=1 Tax=Streptococcus pyogenes TaxID=1314 RepID=UPI003DA0D395